MSRQGRVAMIGLLTAETVSMVGSRMAMVALPWFVLVLTGSPAKAGVVAFAEMLPYVLGCALGGPLLDRIGVRRASIAADAASAVVVAGIPLLYRSGYLGFDALLAAVAVAGLLRALGDTAKRAVFGQVVIGSGIDLTRATGLHDGLSRLAGMLGAPLAGGLIAVLDAPTVLLVDAATFAFGAFALLLTVPRPAVPPAGADTETSESAPRESYLSSLRAGWRFLSGNRLALSICLMLVVTNLVDQAYSSVLAPVWARDMVGSAAALGVLFGLTGVGAVLGNAIFVVLAPRLPRWPVFAIGFLIGGPPRIFATALTDQVWVVYLVTLLGGVALAGLNPIMGAVLYERVPEAMRARVMGMTQAMAWAGIPVGGLLGGLLVQWSGLTVSLLAFATVYLAATLLPFVDRTWRQLDDQPGGDDVLAGERNGDDVPAGEPDGIGQPASSGSASSRS